MIEGHSYPEGFFQWLSERRNEYFAAEAKRFREAKTAAPFDDEIGGVF